MFAIALWTESSRRLVIARDRLGIKPLYIAHLGQDLLFGSELKALFIHPELARRLSLQGLDCYLSLNYVPCPWTLVDGIEKLAPGNWLEWRDGKIRDGQLLEVAVRKSAQLDSRIRKRRTRLTAPKIHARASAFRRAPRRLAQRRRGFLHHPALRRASLHLAPENFLHLIPRPQFR